MRSFLIACAVIIIVAVAGGIVLSNIPDNAAQAFSTSYVRLGA
jgi:uncharacterized membrane protein